MAQNDDLSMIRPNDLSLSDDAAVLSCSARELEPQSKNDIIHPGIGILIFGQNLDFLVLDDQTDRSQIQL